MVLDLKVRIIPDMSLFNRELSRGVSGVGGKGRSGGKKEGIEVKGFKKLLASVFGITAILKSLNFILGPALAILSAVMTLLFIPLIPLLKPVLIGLGKFVKKFAEFARMSKKGWELFLNDPSGGLKIIFTKIITSLKEKILSGLISLGQTFVGAINKIPGVNIPIPQNPFLQSRAGGTSVPSPSRNFNMSTPTGPESTPPPVNISFPNMSVASTHDANTVVDKVLNALKNNLVRQVPFLR